MIEQLREGDVVVVWQLDRLSRSLEDLLHIRDRIEARWRGFPLAHRGDRHDDAGGTYDGPPGPRERRGPRLPPAFRPLGRVRRGCGQKR